LSWLLSRPSLASAIIGPETAAELDAAVPAVELRLDAEQLAVLDALAPPPPSFEQLYTGAMAAAATAHETR
jgi:aryl-alcohol dehydrogenase-like predicted oxidoreductase